MILIILLILSIACIFWWLRVKKFINLEKGFNKRIWFLAISQSFVLSISLGWVIWRFFSRSPQQYSDFVSGSIGFANQNKTIEFYALYAAIFAFVILLVAILKIFEVIRNNDEFTKEVTKLMYYSLVPSAVMFGQSLRINYTPYLLLISSGVIVLSLMIVVFLYYLHKNAIITSVSIFTTGIKVMLALIFFGLSELGFFLFFSRIGGLSYRAGIFSVLLVIAFFSILAIFKKHFLGFNNKLDLSLVISQLGIPFLFTVLLSPPVILQDGSLTHFPYRPLLFILVCCLGIITYADVFVRYRNKKIENKHLLYLISPWILVAILMYLQSNSIEWPRITFDDYHAGEFYLPWWLFKQFGYLPFVDFQVARGLTNYVPGFLSWLFYDNTFSGQGMIINLFSAFYVFLTFFALRTKLGNFVAFLAVFSLYNFVGSTTGGVMVAISCLVILFESKSESNPVNTLWLWLALSLFSSLFMVAEGSIFVIGTLPFVIWLLFRAFKDSRKNLIISLSVLFLVILGLVFTTRVENVILSAIRYIIEQSKVNDIANGIVWQDSRSDINNSVTSGYMWQFIRFSWLLLIIPIAIRLLPIGKKYLPKKEHFFLFALFIMCVVIIPRAVGRIDAVSFSRPGLISIGFVLCCLPIIILPYAKNGFEKSVITLVIVFIFGLLGNQEVNINSAWKLRSNIVTEGPVTISGSTYGFSNIGENVIMDSTQLQRQIRIKQILEKLLTPEETYYDVTNHNSDYGFQGRASPVVDTAFYNSPTEEQQLRTIFELQEKEIPLALINSENIYHDGGKLPLRSFWIYRYLLSSYTPFEDEFGYIWMIRKGKEERLIHSDYTIGSHVENLALLTETFWQKDLAGLPAAWGNSAKGLSNKMNNPQDVLLIGKLEYVNNLNLLENGDWQVNGPDPSIVFTLPQGVKGDLLLIDLSQKINGDYLQVFWENELVTGFQEDHSFLFSAGSSKYIIPVSAAPSWFLSESIQKIRIDFPDAYQGVIHVNNLILYDRTTN